MEPIKCEFCQKLVQLDYSHTSTLQGIYVHTTVENYRGVCDCGRIYRLMITDTWTDNNPEALPDLEGSRRV